MRSATPNEIRRRRQCGENDALVLGILREANGPLSAYDIAFRVLSNGCRIVPNQVYRTLLRLIAKDKAVRIETLNAYVVKQTEANVCLICAECRTVEFVVMPGLRRTMVDSVPGRNFGAITGIVEAQGHCSDCERRHHDPV